MASKKKLSIAYAGLLADIESHTVEESPNNALLAWLRLYKRNNINARTRTGYYFLNALSLLKQQRPNLEEELSVTLWGNIYPGNLELVQNFELENIVKIEGFFPLQKSQEKLRTADVLLLPLESAKDGQEPLNIPGKLYDYLQLEKPILALCEDSDCMSIIRKSGLGKFALPDQAEDIAEKLSQLIEEKSELKEKYQANKEWMNENFSARALTKKLAAIIHETLPTT